MDYDKYVEILQSKRFRVTEQRLQILRVIAENSDKHLTNEEIHDLVKLVNSDIGLATVYRTTQLLAQLGILTTLTIGDGKERYELKKETGGHTHHHLICSICGNVSEVEEDLLDDLEEKVERELGFKVMDHQLKFVGVCAECSAKENE